MVFYAPVLFSSLGMGQESALLSSVITGAVFVAATIISILTVDTFGRRVCTQIPLTMRHSHALSLPDKPLKQSPSDCLTGYAPTTSKHKAPQPRHAFSGKSGTSLPFG